MATEAARLNRELIRQKTILGQIGQIGNIFTNISYAGAGKGFGEEIPGMRKRDAMAEKYGRFRNVKKWVADYRKKEVKVAAAPVVKGSVPSVTVERIGVISLYPPPS